MLRRIGCVFLVACLALTPLSSGVNPALAADATPTPTPAPANVTLTVFAAASLTDAFSVIGKRFETYNPGAKVVFNFAGSQLLSAQINQGAPADVFASANSAQMKVATDGGRMLTSQVFVYNRLVVVYPKDNPGKIKELKDLAKPGLKIVLAAKAVPVGQYTLDFLAKASQDKAFGPTFQADVLANVVSYEDNVKQVFTKVALGEADAGIVYTTDVLGANAIKVSKLAIPDALNTVASYPIAALNDSPNTFWAKGFVRFVLSRDGQRILAQYGFSAAAPTSHK